MNEVTFLIHTFRRPKQLRRLRDSINKYYPNQEVIVYDDSEHDRGLSWGRNHLVGQVKTPYYLLLDDDFVFTEDTKIELLLEKIKDYDIVGGALREAGEIKHYEGRYELNDRILRYIPDTDGDLDFVFNFFLAKKEVSGWDNELKLAEHTAFFFDNKGKWKIGYEPKCIINHEPFRDGEYKDYRERAEKYFDIYMIKKGLKAIQNTFNQKYTLGDYKKNKNILIASPELKSLTGQPMYVKNLKKGLEEFGCKVTCVDYDTPIAEYNQEFDAVIINDYAPVFLDIVKSKNIFNFCHSKNDCDRPIDGCRYLTPRQEVTDHWNIKADILPIPIDIQKWQVEKEKQDTYTIVAPCTIDWLRKPMLLNLIKRAEEGNKVIIVGNNYGALDGVVLNDNVSIFPQTENIIEYMKKADEVAGIFEGTVSYEATAMGIKTSIYDENGNFEYRTLNLAGHNYIDVANKFLQLIK